MIPIQLTLKNFLSYQSATLDFRGLHTACICGANGAGKSSLLEAITWVVWGECRTASDDDLIYSGSNDVRVDFTFNYNYQTYRVIRSRGRGKTAVLEFQIENNQKFKTISGKGIKDTQKQINDCLKLDYDTFINSAYLRQGRADEFMLKKPGERKEVLADLLKLNQYDILARKAKDQGNSIKGQIEELEESLQSSQLEMEQLGETMLSQKQVEQKLIALEEEQGKDDASLQALRNIESQRQTWQNQIKWQEEQYLRIQQDCERYRKQINQYHSQLEAVKTIITQSDSIKANYQEFLNLQQEEDRLSQQFQQYQNLLKKQQDVEQELQQEINQITVQLSKENTRLEQLELQLKENQDILSTSGQIASALEQLNRHRQQLKQLDELQKQVAPLQQRKRELEAEIVRVKDRFVYRVEQLKKSKLEYSKNTAEVLGLRKDLLQVSESIKQLENQQNYQLRVQEKTSEREGQRQQLLETEKVYHKQLKELQQKLDLLSVQGAVCPLCEQHLSEEDKNRVITKTAQQQETIHQQIWQIKEQMITLERDVNSLRQEYDTITQSLEQLPQLRQKQGTLDKQLDQAFEAKERLAEIEAELKGLESSLTVGNYALELKVELEHLEQELQQFEYNEQTHALVRGEVEKMRWAEIKQAKLEDAQTKVKLLQEQKLQILQFIRELEIEIEDFKHHSILKKSIDQIKANLQHLNYHQETHQQITTQLRQSQSSPLRYQKLEEAESIYPQLMSELNQVEELLKTRLEEQNLATLELDQIKGCSIEDKRPEITQLEQKLQQRRSEMDRLIGLKGRLEQQISHLHQLENSYRDNQKKLDHLREEVRVYQELAQAFGRNGIQALMIENILPQLEAESNQILSRLTGNQFHVQFITQKANKKATKVSDTLEIMIADTQGTRAYETYSGGEAFRINFSIRLALARLLAQRAGTALQMLIIDEGFGTQDSDGCDRLIASINAIAGDFACILAVTHIPQFKEAFQTRIEVRKTRQGSRVYLSN